MAPACCACPAPRRRVRASAPCNPAAPPPPRCGQSRGDSVRRGCRRAPGVIALIVHIPANSARVAALPDCKSRLPCRRWRAFDIPPATSDIQETHQPPAIATQRGIPMSFFPGKDPAAGDRYACDALDVVVVPRSVDLGEGFAVRRALPHSTRRTVGPFVFFDHFGPAEFKSGHGLDVRPHPHIGLSTLTYLYDGEIVHRDNLGVKAEIHPGDRKSTRLNSSHSQISYAVFCLKK